MNRPMLRALPFPLILASLAFLLVVMPSPPAGAQQPQTSTVPAEEPQRIYLPFLLQNLALDALPSAQPVVTEPARPTALPTETRPRPTEPSLLEGQVQTESGIVAGTLKNETWSFLGIPYAAPPIDSLRWQPPAEPVSWAPRIFQAKQLGPICPQYEDENVVGAEDCLSLNIWAPRAAMGPGTAPRPVLFFIHGGGHEQGSSAVGVGDRLLYDGQAFADQEGMVVVIINYRLGPFGFLAHPDLRAEREGPGSGNYGMLDQIAALTWVQDNIEGFGGDLDRVTVFGQSAGGVSVCRLIASPLAEGLFSGAVIQSAGCASTTRAKAEANGRSVATALDCADAADVPACMRSRPMSAVINTLSPSENGVEDLGRNTYDGVVDGLALPEAPPAIIEAGRHNIVPLMIGATTAENGRSAPLLPDEATYKAAVRAYVARSGLPSTIADRALEVYPAAGYASPRAAYVALTSDIKFVCPSRRDAQRVSAAQPAPVFRYAFDHVAENGSALLKAQGAFHGGELPYLFGVLEFTTQIGGFTPGPSDRAVSHAMQGYWARFAATGDPNGEGAAAWPRYDTEADEHLHLTAQPAAGAGWRGTECDFWESFRRPKGVMQEAGSASDWPKDQAP